MPWREPQIVPFTRIDIVSSIPPDAGVYAVLEGDTCLLVGESWNLKGKLLELANAINGSDGLVLVYELCEDCDRAARRDELARELTPDEPEPSSDPAPKRLPGISFSDHRRVNGRTG